MPLLIEQLCEQHAAALFRLQAPPFGVQALLQIGLPLLIRQLCEQHAVALFRLQAPPLGMQDAAEATVGATNLAIIGKAIIEVSPTFLIASLRDIPLNLISIS